MRTGLSGRGDYMRERTYITYAHEAASKLNKINRLLTGTDCLDEGGLLGDAYYCIADMIELCLVPVVGKEIHSDELNDITVEIMSAESHKLNGILEKYSK